MSRHVHSMTESQFNRLRQLFWQGIELPIPDRTQWLAAMSEKEDSDLLRHLRELLEAHSSAGAFLGDPDVRLPAPGRTIFRRTVFNSPDSKTPI